MKLFNLKRRSLLLLAALSGLPSFAQAAGEPAPRPVYVVKFVSFACNFCRASERGDSLIAEAARKTGGDLVVAPIDTAEAQNYIKERFYYAFREIQPADLEAARNLMYVATQDYGQQFSSSFALDTWLTVNAPTLLEADQRKQVVNLMNSEAVTGAIGRAVRLAKSAGVDTLPAYALVQDGEVKAILDRQGYPSLNDLRDKLGLRIQSLVAIRKQPTLSE